MEQFSIFDELYETFKIKNKIRLIELFAGYGSQNLSLKYIGADYESWKICEWAIKSIQAYKDIHYTDCKDDYSKNLTKEEIIDFLYKKGVSQNYNEPMDYKQIARLSEDQLRAIYNNIQITKNLVNIQQVKGNDLEISDTDKYTYLLTYSFPCQDLSMAGTRKLMARAKDGETSTRSGMLWEVERILFECKELGNLPQVLLMENVPQVHGEGAKEDFVQWQLQLERLGYKNYWQDLMATDYGIPQTRNRCFMVSILGDYVYNFPRPIPLKLKLKDMLEDEVDKKYFISEKQIKDIESWNAYEKPLENMEKTDKTNISPTLTTRSGAYAAGMILIKNNTKKESPEATQEDVSVVEEKCIGTYQFAKSDKFMGGKDRLQLGKETSDTIQTSQKEAVVIGNYMPSNHNASRIVDPDYSAPTVMECHGTVTTIQKDLRIRKLMPIECFRLMGVRDEDFWHCAKNQTDSSLYHLAGDSIVVDVLEYIIKQML